MPLCDYNKLQHFLENCKFFFKITGGTMKVIEKIKVCCTEELENFFSLIVSKNNNNTIVILEELINRANYLEEYQFVCDKFDIYMLKKNKFEKTDSLTISRFLYSHIRMGYHLKNIWIYEQIKSINFDFITKGKLLNYISFSYRELKNFEAYNKLLFEIKHIDDLYLENYIDSLFEVKKLDLALKELKKYSPKNDKGKIWKSIHLALVYHEKNDLLTLEKAVKNAEECYRNFRENQEIQIHSMLTYYLGLFHIKLNNIPKAINYLRTSIGISSELVIDSEYKKKSQTLLQEIGVRH